MLDFFHSLTPIYNKFQSQMKQGESCENVVSLAKTGSDYRVMIFLNKDGNIVSGKVIDKDDGILVYKSGKNNVSPRIRVSNIDRNLESDIRKSVLKLVNLVGDIIETFNGSKQELPKNHTVRKFHDILCIATIDPVSFLKKSLICAKKTIQDTINNDKIINEEGIDLVFDLDSNNNFQSSMKDITIRKNALASHYVGDSSTMDIFGNSGKISDEAFGKVHNWFALYQRDENVGAYSSYGVNSVEACPLSIENRKIIYNTASWIMSEDNRKKFWNRRFSGNKQDIIVALPDIENVSLAEDISSYCYDIIGDDEDFFANIDKAGPGKEKYKEAEESIENYSSRSASAIDALNGLISKEPFAKFLGFIASKKGDNAFGISSNLNFSAQKLLEAISWWSECCSTSVRRRIPKFSKGKFIGFYDSKPIHPFQIPRIMNIHWTSGAGVSGDGSIIPKYCDKITFERFSQSDAISLFLDKNIIVADRIIREFSEHHASLVIDVTKRSNRQEKCCLLGSRLDVFQLPSIVNVAFSVKGITPMDRENNIGFIFGQLLGIADWLHASRCYTRNERLPADLIGSRFTSAFSGRYNLSNAINSFTRDFQFISDWSKTVLYKNCIKNVNKEISDEIIIKYRWFEKLFSKINKDIPERLSIDDAAMLALGYYSVRSFYPHKIEAVAS